MTTTSPYTWVTADDGTLSCSYENRFHGKVQLGTVKEVNGEWECVTIINFEGDTKKAILPTEEIGKDWVEGGGHRTYCKECNTLHEGVAFCDCGACLYNHSTHIPDEMYPLFRCNKCKKVNFWD